jgi:microcystin-dependent protein
MSQLNEVLTLGANNTAGEFALSGDTLAVLFYALDFVQNLNNWRDYADEELDTTTVDEIRALVDNATDSLMRPIMSMPIGAMIMHAANVIPDKWLICDGAAIDRTTYAELFAVIGTDYGAGNGTTTFNIPDWRDLSPMGQGGGLVGLPGAVNGASEHVLTVGEMPTHNHGINDPGHTHAPLSTSTTFLGNKPGSSNTAPAGSGIGTSATTASATTGIGTTNTGDGLAHNNLHPVMGATFLIYTGVL